MYAEEFNASDFQVKVGVSDETLNLYERWFRLLNRWNSKINLVGSSTMDDFWQRHALDSHQLFSLLPRNSQTIIDLGAGAGFPGIALAILMRDRPGVLITMVESNGKKSNFLRAVIRDLTLPAEAIQERAENLTPRPYDVVTARAFAPLPKLLSYAQPFWREGTLGIFPKGESWEAEILDAQAHWDFKYSTTASQTNDSARIIKIENAKPKTMASQGKA